jgi:GNAT superfamily N-acetyltransferase
VSEVTLRDADASDAGSICGLVAELAEFEQLAHLARMTPASIAEELSSSSPVAHVILAEIGGDVAGMALWYPTFSTFLSVRGIWLEDLIVRPEFRRRGVASALLGELVGRSPGRVEWEVLDWNEGAIGLYQAVGALPHTGWIKYRVDPEAG